MCIVREFKHRRFVIDKLLPIWEKVVVDYYRCFVESKKMLGSETLITLSEY